MTVFDRADALNAIHKGAPVLSHPSNIAVDESAWQREHVEEQKGRQAYQALSELFDEEIDEDE